MNTPSPHDRRAELRETIQAVESKLKRLERGPARNTMLAAATAAHLTELRTELADLGEEQSPSGGGAGVGSRSAGDVSVLHQLRPETSVRGNLRPETSVREHLRSTSGEQLLTEAHATATSHQTRTPSGAATIRAALAATESTYAQHDGWLWADEALDQIERGDNKPALWEKIADNLATLLPAAR